MKTLHLYFALFTLDIFLLYVFIPVMVTSFISSNFIVLIISSIVVASELNDMITRQQNFIKYYPHFEDKWLNLFYLK